VTGGLRRRLTAAYAPPVTGGRTQPPHPHAPNHYSDTLGGSKETTILLHGRTAEREERKSTWTLCSDCCRTCCRRRRVVLARRLEHVQFPRLCSAVTTPCDRILACIITDTRVPTSATSTTLFDASHHCRLRTEKLYKFSVL